MCMGYRVYIESFWSEDYASQTADSEPWPRSSNLCTIAMIMNYASTTSHKVHISFILIVRIFQKFYTSPLVCRPEDLDVHGITPDGFSNFWPYEQLRAVLKKKVGVDYEHHFRAVFSCFHRQKKLV